MNSRSALCCLLALPLTGCVVAFPVEIYLQNASGQPLNVRLHYREWVHPLDTVHLRYQAFLRGGSPMRPACWPPTGKPGNSSRPPCR
jgi:hypothetical protein